MRRGANTALLLVCGLFFLAAGPALAACKLLQVAEFHTDLSTGVPVVDGAINGKPIHILIQTGSDRSFLLANAARAMGLPLRQYSDRKQYTTSGVIQVMTASVQRLQIGTLNLKNPTLAALDDRGAPGDITFLVGADLFSAYDTEIDLAHGVIRLFQPVSCKTGELVYWSNGYFMTKLTTPSPNDPHLGIQILLNGNSTHAWLSTGARTSSVDKLTAQNAGVKLGTDAAPLLAETEGSAPVWNARFDTVAIGNETIHNPRLRVADLFGRDQVQRTGSMVPQRVEGFADMLLGADFLIAHRVMILPHEHQMLFTYNGGPIFTAPSMDASASGPKAAPSAEPAAVPTQQH